jgi:hypothetical protein
MNGTAMQLVRVISRVEDMKIWNANSLARVVLERVLEPGWIVLTFDDLAVIGRFAPL